jgi:hypothetical protein
VIDGEGKSATRFAAAAVTEKDASPAACDVLHLAGARFLSGGQRVLDATDQGFFSGVMVPGCS